MSENEYPPHVRRVIDEFREVLPMLQEKAKHSPEWARQLERLLDITTQYIIANTWIVGMNLSTGEVFYDNLAKKEAGK